MLNDLLIVKRMKPELVKTIIRNVFLGVFTMMILLSFNSCATKAKFVTSTVVPAARGDVKVKKNNNNNYAIEIEISNLAEVERLQPQKQVYVVWLITEQDETKNLGQIVSASSTFSDNLKASFKAVSVNKPTKIFITAENNGIAVYPGGQVILTTNRF